MRLPDEYKENEWGGTQKPAREKTQEPEEIRSASTDLEMLKKQEETARKALEEASVWGDTTARDRAREREIENKKKEIEALFEKQNPKPKTLLERLKEAKENKK